MHRKKMVAVAALLTSLIGTALVAPTAAATPKATVVATTQQMVEPTLNYTQAGSYKAQSTLSLACYETGQAVKGHYSPWLPNGGWDNIWYRTSDGHWAADVDLSTGSQKPVTPKCSEHTAGATVMATTQRMTASNLNVHRAGTYTKGLGLALRCYAHGEAVKGYYSRWLPNGGWDNIWYQVTDGYWVADVDVNSGSQGVVTRPCGSNNSSGPASPASGSPTDINGIKVGYPMNSKHAWGACTVQDFDRGPLGRLIVDYTHGTNIVRGGMLWGWFDNGAGPGLGCAKNQEHTLRLTVSAINQDFDKGSLYWTSSMGHSRKAVPLVALQMRWTKRTLTFSYTGKHKYYGNAWQAARNWTNAIPGIEIVPAAPGHTGDIVFQDVWKPFNSWVGQTQIPSGWQSLARADSTFHSPSRIYIDANTDQMTALSSFYRTYVLTHELGHALGLAHSNGVADELKMPSIMMQESKTFNPYSQKFNTPEKFDIMSLEELYGRPLT